MLRASRAGDQRVRRQGRQDHRRRDPRLVRCTRSRTRTTPNAAVRAALRMQETLRDYCAETGAQIQLRIGVNTGEVLVGSLRAGAEYTAMGDVVNTAQRLQTTATPGCVVVGPATYAATRDVIDYRSLGARRGQGSRGACRRVGSDRDLVAPRLPATSCAEPVRRSRRRARHPRRARSMPPWHAAVPIWCCSSVRRVSARAGSRPRSRSTRAPLIARSCTRVAACPTARPTCGGPWPRHCGRRARSTRTTEPRRHVSSAPTPSRRCCNNRSTRPRSGGS